MLRPTSPYRRSSHIARHPASAFIHAPRIAAKIGRPLNLHVAIRWRFLGCPEEEASKVFEKFRLGPFAHWSRYMPVRERRPRNGVPTYAWVFEAKAPTGIHVHWCVHIEAGRERSFEAALRRWVKSALKLRVLPSDEAVGVRPITDMHRFKLYLLKGTEPRYAAACRLRRVEDQGEVVGKRCGVSANLNRSSRLKLEGRWKFGGHHDDPSATRPRRE